jgi:hypothetical protein
MLKLLNNLLDVTKIRRGKLERNIVPVKTIEPCVIILQHHSIARDDQVKGDLNSLTSLGDHVLQSKQDPLTGIKSDPKPMNWVPPHFNSRIILMAWNGHRNASERCRGKTLFKKMKG